MDPMFFRWIFFLTLAVFHAQFFGYNVPSSISSLQTVSEASISFTRLSLEQIEEYSQEIQAFTEEINSYPKGLCPVELKNQRGLFLFLSEKYDAAIEDFEDVIRRFEGRNVEDRSLYASALWGRFLAHAFSDDIEKSLTDLFLIRELFLYRKCNCKQEILSSNGNQRPSYSLFQVAEFADPEEKLTPEQCKLRVKGTAIAMRALCLKIPNSAIRFAAETSIRELEEIAYSCCEREHWTECLSPIVDAWNYLKNCMDKGVKYAPYVLFPSSNVQSIQLENISNVLIVL